MVDQYPFEGYTDRYPETETTPDWWGFGLKNFDHRSHPVKHILYADGNRRAVIEVHPTDENSYVGRQIMDRLKGREAERPQLSIAVHNGYDRTPGNGHWQDPMWQLPDTRPARARIPGRGWGEL